MTTAALISQGFVTHWSLCLRKEPPDMQQWDYLTVNAICRDKENNASELSIDTDQGRIWGLEDILKHYGREGWELVNCLPSQWDEAAATEQPELVTGVTAVFKRPLG